MLTEIGLVEIDVPATATPASSQSTNAIESLEARYRRAVKTRGHFPTEQAELKFLYLVARSLDPIGRSRTRWAMRWKPALNAFAIALHGRIVPSTTD